VVMNKLKNKKLFVLVSTLVIVLDCTIDILLLRAFWKKLEEKNSGNRLTAYSL